MLTSKEWNKADFIFQIYLVLKLCLYQGGLGMIKCKYRKSVRGNIGKSVSSHYVKNTECCFVNMSSYYDIAPNMGFGTTKLLPQVPLTSRGHK